MTQENDIVERVLKAEFKHVKEGIDYDTVEYTEDGLRNLLTKAVAEARKECEAELRGRIQKELEDWLSMRVKRIKDVARKGFIEIEKVEKFRDSMLPDSDGFKWIQKLIDKLKGEAEPPKSDRVKHLVDVMSPRLTPRKDDESSGFVKKKGVGKK